MLDTWCPHCGKTWQYPEAYSGQSVQCYCGQWLMIPTIEPIIGNRFREDRYGIHERNWYALYSQRLAKLTFVFGCLGGVGALFFGPWAIACAFRGLDSDYWQESYLSLIIATLSMLLWPAFFVFAAFAAYSRISGFSGT